MNTSQFMDKQIMDLSSQSHKDFIDLMKPQEEGQIDGGIKKEEILPSYDFQPIRPIGSSSSPPDFDSSVVGGLRALNSADNKSSPPGSRNYTSSDSFEPAKVISEKDPNTVGTNLVFEIDRTMKKYADNLLHALDGVSARLSQLESRSHNLESSVDHLSVSVGNNHENSDRKMRQLEHILREVQNGVQDIKDKQEIMDARLQLAKLQVSKVEQHEVTQPSLKPIESSQSVYSTAQLPHQQISSAAALVQPPPTLIPPNAPPPPPPSSNQNFLNTGQLLSNYTQNQAPRQEPYFPPPGQAPENQSQPYQVPPQQLQTPPPPQQQYLPPHSQYSQPPASPRQPVIPNVNLPQHPQTLGHHSEETPYMQSQSYPPNINAAPPPPQYYGPPPPNPYEPQSSRPSPVFSGAYGPSHASSESYPYNNTSQYQNSSPLKPQLPTARPLPHAYPTPSGGVNGGGSASASSGNKVPIDDVVERVTNMGFPRDHVRATVRKLTDNGEAVDLNVVLDKLMNGGPAQEIWRP